MLSGNCTEALSIQANVTISGPSTKLIKNGIAPLPFPLPALLKQYWYIKRGEGQGEGTCSILCNVRVEMRPAMAETHFGASLCTQLYYTFFMPSFDIVSQVNPMEIEN